MLNSLEGMCQPKVGLNEHFPVGVVLTVPFGAVAATPHQAHTHSWHQ